MLSPSPCSLLPAPMQPQPEILAYWTGSLPPHLSFLKMKLRSCTSIKTRSEINFRANRKRSLK
jgi:hypothetical protein